MFSDEADYKYLIGPLQVAIHVVQNRRTGEQKSHCDKRNKGNYHLKLCMPFVCLVPVRLLLTSTAGLYHVNGYLQRAYWSTWGRVSEIFHGAVGTWTPSIYTASCSCCVSTLFLRSNRVTLVAISHKLSQRT